jgi:hypothetical protein
VRATPQGSVWLPKIKIRITARLKLHSKREAGQPTAKRPVCRRKRYVRRCIKLRIGRNNNGGGIKAGNCSCAPCARSNCSCAPCARVDVSGQILRVDTSAVRDDDEDAGRRHRGQARRVRFCCIATKARRLRLATSYHETGEDAAGDRDRMRWRQGVRQAGQAWREGSLRPRLRAADVRRQLQDRRRRTRAGWRAARQLRPRTRNRDLRARNSPRDDRRGALNRSGDMSSRATCPSRASQPRTSSRARAAS